MLYIVQLRVNPTNNVSRLLSINTTGSSKERCCEYWFSKGKQWGYRVQRKSFLFTACHSGKLKPTFTSPNIISTSPKNVLMSRLISQFFCNLNSSKKFICPSGKLLTEFTSPIAKSTSPRLSDTTFSAN